MKPGSATYKLLDFEQEVYSLSLSFCLWKWPGRIMVKKFLTCSGRHSISHISFSSLLNPKNLSKLKKTFQKEELLKLASPLVCLALTQHSLTEYVLCARHNFQCGREAMFPLSCCKWYLLLAHILPWWIRNTIKIPKAYRPLKRQSKMF